MELKEKVFADLMVKYGFSKWYELFESVYRDEVDIIVAKEKRYINRTIVLDIILWKRLG